jgi:hypothetical protein
VENGASIPPQPQPPVGGTATVMPRDRGIAALCALLLVIGMPIGYLSGDTSTGDVIGLIVLGLVSLLLIAAAVLWLVPRERAAPPQRAARTALILGVLAVLTVLVFWTGVPFPLGAGAIALGLGLRESAPAEGGRATGAVVLGALGVVASFVLLLVG